MDKKSFAMDWTSFVRSPAGQQLELWWNVQREAIISKGMANRKDEMGIKYWAELAGFEKARMLPYKMAAESEKKESTVMEE